MTDIWSKERGPDPMFEYDEFRSNVLENLEDRIFDKPLCEVMHNQKYFNGIGNYLRAEVILRLVPVIFFWLFHKVTIHKIKTAK